MISFVDGWSYFIVSWIEFDKTSGGLPTSPNRSSSNAAALESNRCLNMVYGQGHPDRAGRSRTYLTTRLSSLLTASVSSLFIPDASLGVSGSNHLELAGDWNRYFLIKWDSRAKIIILRVVQNQVILKSMSERGGSDIQRLWNWMIYIKICSKSIEYLNSGSVYVGSAFFRHWFSIWSGVPLTTLASFRSDAGEHKIRVWPVHTQFIRKRAYFEWIIFIE